VPLYTGLRHGRSLLLVLLLTASQSDTRRYRAFARAKSSFGSQSHSPSHPVGCRARQLYCPGPPTVTPILAIWDCLHRLPICGKVVFQRLI